MINNYSWMNFTMPVPDNFLVNVKTYQDAELAYLQNLYCFIATTNKKFENFTTLTANLGESVMFKLPTRMTTTKSLVATFQPVEQRFRTLTIDQQVSSSCAFTDQQRVENVKDYMREFGMPSVNEIGADIEATIARNCLTNTYRFYNGTGGITSYTQLAQALAQFRNYGSANGRAKGYLADMVVPGVIGGSLGQFVLDRNERAANSWELGSFSNCDWYQSNMMPVHIAGSVGRNTTPANNIMTVVSSTFNGPGNSIDTITFSVLTGASDADCIKQYDRIEFNDIAGQPLLRYLTFIGHKVSQNKVQIQATANAASTAGSQVTITINPPLQVLPTAEQNINTPIVAGMTATVMPSHRSGLITAGDPFFLAMPRLPDTTPFPGSSAVDPETGASLRMYYGHGLGDNTNGMIHDAIYGSDLVPEYSMAILQPI